MRASAFNQLAKSTAHLAGRPSTFALAVAVIVVWLLTGPVFGFSDTWQLVINTGTTIVTFLMVFLIQNSQNRDSAALQIKLDELIRATRARNSLLDVDNLDEDALERIRENYRKLAHNKKEEARQKEQQARQARHPGRRVRAAAESEEACEELREIERELAQASPDHAGADADPDAAAKPG